MHSQPSALTVSAICRRSRETREQKAAYRFSNYQCDIHSYNSSFHCQSNLPCHGDSIHATQQQCPFDQCEYKTGRVDKVKEHLENLHGVPNKCPKTQPDESSNDSHYHQTYGTHPQNILSPADRVDIGDLSNLAEVDSYEETSSSQIQSSNDTYASVSSSFEFAGFNNSVVLFGNTTTFLNGIGQWADDHSNSGSTWNAWQNPDVLLQHAARCRLAFNTLKPHVEEAMDCFQASFYGLGRTAPEYRAI